MPTASAGRSTDPAARSERLTVAVSLPTADWQRNSAQTIGTDDIPPRDTVWLERMKPMSLGGGKRNSRGGRTERAGQRHGGDAAVPLAEVDHGMLDIVVVDADRSLGRPILTVALDSASRLVIGFTLRFEARRQ